MSAGDWAVAAYTVVCVLLVIADRFIWWPRRVDADVERILLEMLARDTTEAERLHVAHPDWTAEQITDAVIQRSVTQAASAHDTEPLPATCPSVQS